ncbi:hypothetical protein [Herbaspirillum lusitanum]|uniref:hypothetical protein n=1 Tax=Herbaspirillum lusitanum TaxID=213312 RepID=UPI0012F508E7|nr:hypothetical protein [Herbaspirillum lusitanum]
MKSDQETDGKSSHGWTFKTGPIRMPVLRGILQSRQPAFDRLSHFFKIFNYQMDRQRICFGCRVNSAGQLT